MVSTRATADQLAEHATQHIAAHALFSTRTRGHDER